MVNNSNSSSISSSQEEEMAIKLVKKSLKREGSGCMKLKSLSKLIAKEMGDNDTTAKMIKKWIKKSNEFTIDITTTNDDKDNNTKKKKKEIVYLNKKRKRPTSPDSVADEITLMEKEEDSKKRTCLSEEEEEDQNDDVEEEENKRKKSKKSKKSKSKSKTKSKTKTEATITNTSNNDNTSPSSTATAYEAVAEWRKEHKIVLKDCKDDEEGRKRTKELGTNKCYFPFQTFDDPVCRDHIAPALLRQCTEGNGFQYPTPIQAQSWPILLNASSSSSKKQQQPHEHEQKRDMVGIAETGSGKTLAFGLVALSSMAADNSNTTSNNHYRYPRMLVLSPTRELAMQSEQVLKEFGSVVGLSTIVLYGGVPKYEQSKSLKRGQIDIIVATPGRIKDLIDDGSCNLEHIEHLVLDEADRMLDMGFEQDVRYIVSQCPDPSSSATSSSSERGQCQGRRRRRRQTCMFSATWPAAIQKIAMEYMNDPLRVYVGFDTVVSNNSNDNDNNDDTTMTIDDSLSANKRVQQIVEVIDEYKRESRLQQILQKHHKNPDTDHPNRILIFCLYKKEAERMEYTLRQRYGWDCCSIHGNKHQTARTKALEEFKRGTCPLLVATDVAARGLDIPHVEVVINYTFPLTIEDYIHRIGRTGRAGQSGISYTFFQPSDKSLAGALQQVIKQAGQVVPEELFKFGSTIKKKEHQLYGNFGPSTSSIPMKKATKITFNYSDEE